VLIQQNGAHIVLGRPGPGDRVPGIWFEGRGDPALIVDSEGAEAAVTKPSLQKMRKLGRPVLLIDAFQTGTAVATRDRSVRNFLTFNRQTTLAVYRIS